MSSYIYIPRNSISMSKKKYNSECLSLGIGIKEFKDIVSFLYTRHIRGTGVSYSDFEKFAKENTSYFGLENKREKILKRRYSRYRDRINTDEYHTTSESELEDEEFAHKGKKRDNVEENKQIIVHNIHNDDYIEYEIYRPNSDDSDNDIVDASTDNTASISSDFVEERHQEWSNNVYWDIREDCELNSIPILDKMDSFSVSELLPLKKLKSYNDRLKYR